MGRGFKEVELIRIKNYSKLVEVNWDSKEKVLSEGIRDIPGQTFFPF
jgi:hypothetical protein